MQIYYSTFPLPMSRTSRLSKSGLFRGHPMDKTLDAKTKFAVYLSRKSIMILSYSSPKIDDYNNIV